MSSIGAFLLLSLLVGQLAVVRSAAVRPTVTNTLCYNGRKDASGACVCDQDYAGRLCERKKHCAGFERQANLSCVDCESGWTGAECDHVDCGPNGVPASPTLCTCQKPYSGQFCEELRTKDVYLYYNKAIYSMGPLGVLSILPLLCILFGCKKLAQVREVKRAEEVLENHFQKDISTDAVESLLSK
ncbi:Tenascin-X [Aphelenchoides fujianensis]|nr:Tenascin-X [Aphelenchoides fujianensis]